MEKFKKIILKILKWTGISIAAILFLMFIIPIFFPGTISQQVKIFANQHLAGKLDYKKRILRSSGTSLLLRFLWTTWFYRVQNLFRTILY
ncbi:hypothetical protein [Chryseobacterium herbae]|uniref:Uncharacterized protein n=1 Tax=Chryseobacterium herbae TaxID=2976476 RepID=A0ABT2IYQ1_9FLAO|nr:hypothetical protein [Chryseobacterium sp. pc1-10]MCT2563927.1 hypothetical protein [Chryseobacterium sp. pc1-10]